MSSHARGIGRRLSLITFDQVISSASNVLIAVVAARLLNAESFGIFALVFITYVTAQGVWRAVIAGPLLVQPDEAVGNKTGVLGASLILGLAVGGLLLVGAAAAWLIDRDFGIALAVSAVAAPLLAVQDVGRYLAFTLHQPARALEFDLAWLVLGAVGFGSILAMNANTVYWVIAAWAGTGAVSGLTVLHRYGAPNVAVGLTWLRESWSLAWRYLVAFLSTQGGAVLASIAIIGILGPVALGAVRGALLLYGPMVQLQAAAVTAGVSEMARLSSGQAELRRHVSRSTAVTTGAAVVALVVLVLLPDNVGRLVLGDTWTATATILVPAGVHKILLGSISGVRSALLGFRQIHITLRIDLAATVIVVVATVAGAWTGGLVAAMWCQAAAQSVVVGVWWTVYSRHARDGRPVE